MTLTDFLLARIAEDEAVASSAADDFAWQREQDFGGFTVKVYDHIVRHDPARVLAECEARRRIVGYLLAAVSEGDSADVRHAYLDAVSALAGVYADHDDYREEWRP